MPQFAAMFGGGGGAAGAGASTAGATAATSAGTSAALNAALTPSAAQVAASSSGPSLVSGGELGNAAKEAAAHGGTQGSSLEQAARMQIDARPDFGPLGPGAPSGSPYGPGTQHRLDGPGQSGVDPLSRFMDTPLPPIAGEVPLTPEVTPTGTSFKDMSNSQIDAGVAEAAGLPDPNEGTFWPEFQEYMSSPAFAVGAANVLSKGNVGTSQRVGPVNPNRFVLPRFMEEALSGQQATPTQFGGGPARYF